MSSSYKACHLTCELNVLRARNLETEYFSGLFIRCYVSVGGGRCVRVDSREIPASCSPCQSPLAVMETQGDADYMGKLLEKHGVVFELRRRRRTATPSLLGRFSRSKLVGRASVAWKEVMEMSAERWITVDTGSSMPRDQKLPAVLVEMSVRLSEKPEKAGRPRAPDQWEECRCSHCEWNLEEEDMFALANTIPAAC